MNPYANGLGNAQPEYEWEQQEAAHHTSANEWEAEDRLAVGRRLGSIRQTARASAPLAQQLVPIAASRLLGQRASPRATVLLGSLSQAGDRSATAMEAQLFGRNNAALRPTEAAYEAALAEVLAAEASHSNSESEAEAFLGAAVPGIVHTMGGSNALRLIMPTLVLANARLVNLLHQKGPEGRRLLRLVPTILRRTIASLGTAHRSGHPITSELALRLMADHISKVFGDANRVTIGILRNAMIQKQTMH